jgi:agmatine deiminase
MTENTLPQAAGYRMPAEWEPHARCWMAWPCRRELWGDGLDAARAAYAAVARAISRFEPVTMVARLADADEAGAICGPDVGIAALPLDDSWMRDIGPTFVCDAAGEVAGVCWRFNAWGGKYGGYEADDALGGRLIGRLGMPRFDAPFVLEGGAIHSDGEGTILTTESVLLNSNRDMAGNRDEAAALLRDWLGAEKVIWLPAGMAADETDGHVDNVACFVAPGRVLALASRETSDPNHERLQENLAVLAAERDARGRPLDIIRLEQATLPDETGNPGAASYINFYIANGGIVMPRFGTDDDAPAAETVRRAFPDRHVVQVDARAIVRGGGGIHCITQQQPAGRAEAECDR